MGNNATKTNKEKKNIVKQGTNNKYTQDLSNHNINNRKGKQYSTIMITQTTHLSFFKCPIGALIKNLGFGRQPIWRTG